MLRRRLVAVAAALAALAVPPAAAQADTDFPTEEALVDQAYRDVLSRGPDAAGLTYWADELRAGTTPAALHEFLVTSAEFQSSTAPIVRLYHSIFGRVPDGDGLRFWVGARRDGVDLERVAADFLAGAEFEALAAAQTNDEIVAAVYGRSLGRTPDADGLAYWRGELDAGRLTLAQFVVAVSESAEHVALLAERVTVTQLYLGLLGRAPEPDGLVYWQERVAAGVPLRELAASILDSAEYDARFPDPPTLTVTTIDGFSLPWGIAELPGGEMVVTERGGSIRLVSSDGSSVRTVAADLSWLRASGETGLMGAAVDPDFATNGRLYTCGGHVAGDVRVVAWQLDPVGATATLLDEGLVTGMPFSTGRHGGCQLEIDDDGALWIGTGDAAVGTTPQDLGSLGGKVLRVDRFTGDGWPTNPFADSDDPATRLVVSYGHRNVQGLALRPDTDQIWSVEHGPSRDDEINLVRSGGNAGWDPAPGYDESVPMTDLRLPGAYPAAWSTGSPTLALSGAEWLDDDAWGSLDGTLAVTALKDRALRFFLFDADGRSLGVTDPLTAPGSPRLRGVTQASDGRLWVTTSGGDDALVVWSAG